MNQPIKKEDFQRLLSLSNTILFTIDPDIKNDISKKKIDEMVADMKKHLSKKKKVHVMLIKE